MIALPLRTCSRTWIGGRALGSLMLMSALAVPWADVRAAAPTYSIDFHVITSGASEMQNSCFRLWGTVGQTAPGYSSGSTYSVIGGFWPATTSFADTDAIFFNGFEGC